MIGSVLSVDRGLTKIEPSREVYFGEDLMKSTSSKVDQFSLCKTQNLCMELYEGRIASLERFVAMTVMFHELGTRVQQFFPAVSLGYLRYRTDRTQSMCRIATTASPVSGADVRERMDSMKLTKVIIQSVRTITNAWFNYRTREAKRLLKQNSLGLLLDVSEGTNKRSKLGLDVTAFFPPRRSLLLSPSAVQNRSATVAPDSELDDGSASLPGTIKDE
jgi:hypothetical protein